MVIEKKCSKCKETKPIESFHKHAKENDGYRRQCKLCVKSYSKRYYELNAENLKTKSLYYARSNRSKVRSYHKIWRDNNVGKCRELDKRKYYAKKNAQGSHTRDDIQQKVEQQKHRCAYCSVKLQCDGAGKYHTDHIKPLCQHGSDNIENIVLTCPKCNLSKGTKTLGEWSIFLEKHNQLSNVIASNIRKVIASLK